MEQSENTNLVLIGGETGVGKTASLMALKDDNGIMYLNCESGKRTPYKNNFLELNVVDPLQVFEAFEEAENMDEIHTIVIDSLTYLMDMFESDYVLTAQDKRSAWSDYAQFFKKLMQTYVKTSSKNVIFLAHTLTTLNESEHIMQVSVPIKGALKNQGIESYFSCVLSAKKVALKDLKEYGSDSLNITPEDEALGFKHVFQTRLTKETFGERIRSPIGMWDVKETFIDNNVGFVLERLKEYYED